MPERPPRFGQRPTAQPVQSLDRPTAHQRGYGSRWRRAALAFLAEHPLCAACAREGRTTAARVVDHIVPHRGDRHLFWQTTNWQPLCTTCHNQKTAAGQ